MSHPKEGPEMLRGSIFDTTERIEFENTLRDLSRRFITVQEEERKRIGRELHDDLSQRMALVSIDLEQLSQTASNHHGGLEGSLRDIQQRAQEIAADIHRISHKLHPSKLYHLGLVPALESFCRELSRSREIQVNFTRNVSALWLHQDKSLCIFRVAQEALQNAAKHSGASEINISLIRGADAVELTVSDRGSGFDANSRKMKEGLGLTSMRERVRVVYGRMQVHSKPSDGCRIEVSVPIDDIGQTIALNSGIN